MSPGVERFLILGCIAILILEAPSLLKDLRLGNGSYAVLAAERAPLVEAEVRPAESGEPVAPVSHQEPAALALAERRPLDLAALSPEQPGL